MKKKWTVTILLIVILIPSIWAFVDLWNYFHIVTLIFLVDIPWLLGAVLGIFNLYRNQPRRPKIKILLIVMSLIGTGAFVYGVVTNNDNALLLSFLFLAIAGVISLVFLTSFLKQDFDQDD